MNIIVVEDFKKSIYYLLDRFRYPLLDQDPAGPGANSANCQLEKNDVGQLDQVPTEPSGRVGRWLGYGYHLA
jgi:hypothetical protein